MCAAFQGLPHATFYHSTLPLPHCWIRGASDNYRATGPGGAAAYRQAAAARAKRSRDPAACGVGGTWGQAPSPHWMDTLPLDRYSEVRAGPPSTRAPKGAGGTKHQPSTSNPPSRSLYRKSLTKADIEKVQLSSRSSAQSGLC